MEITDTPGPEYAQVTSFQPEGANPAGFYRDPDPIFERKKNVSGSYPIFTFLFYMKVSIIDIFTLVNK